MIFDKRIFIRNEVLKSDIIYDSLFRFRNINLDNVNDIYLAINIIVIITTTFFKIFIVAVFVFELVIVIVFNINDIVIIIIIIFEKPILKLIIFDFNIKRRFIINALFNKS